MMRIGILVISVALIFSCKNDDKETEVKSDFDKFTMSFKDLELPFELTEEKLNKISDTTSVITGYIQPYMPDSIKRIVAGTADDVRYTAIGKLLVKDAENYFLIKTNTKNKRPSALLLVYDKDRKFSAALPFLVPDDDNTTTQSASIDGKYNITRSVIRKKGEVIIGDGKDVFVYDKNTNGFTWIITNPLDESDEVINPIDTFPGTHKLSGDYIRNKKNIVSIRNGRSGNHILVFIHIEKDEGECKGEMKGEFLLTTPTTALYSQGGDPCVMQLKFSGTSVSISEEQGCGNHRDISCVFEGTFNKKKPAKESKKSTKNL